eukprot:Skav225636  [mRNA]  locus=scaffold1716:55992:66249:+ [translate_table: standard]
MGSFQSQASIASIQCPGDLMQTWEEIPEDEKAFQLRLMEARMRTWMAGLFNNTLVIYILGDNGASAEGFHGTIDELLTENSLPNTAQQQMEARQGQRSRGTGQRRPLLVVIATKDNMYHSSWAWALDTPFKSTKLVAAHFGGTRTPMAMSWPKVGPEGQLAGDSARHHAAVPVPSRLRHCPHYLRGHWDQVPGARGWLRADAVGWRLYGVL